MIALADYGASNTRSVLRALLAAGAEAPTLTDDPATLRRAERVVLPGVGNFAAAKRRLDETGLGEAIADVAKSGRPVLGICLGLQLFLADSEEAPGVPGLGLLPGRVARFHTELPVPHVGWARVRLTAGGRASSRSEEHTSELQSQSNLVCRLLLEKKNTKRPSRSPNYQRSSS